MIIKRKSLPFLIILAMLAPLLYLFKKNYAVGFSITPSLPYYVFFIDKTNTKVVKNDLVAFYYPGQNVYSFQTGEEFVKIAICLPNEILTVNTNLEYFCNGKKISQAKKEDSKGKKLTPFLFNGSIRYNLLFSNQEASDDEIQNVLRLSGLKKFIEDLPEGLDTIIGEDGLKISGGERQRIVLGRVLLADPDILIMDESTSALDSVTTKEIMEAIKMEYKDKTVIVIAHKLTTIIDLQEIYVMMQGRIASFGSHKKLLDSSDIYRKLYQSQFAKSEVG